RQVLGGSRPSRVKHSYGNTSSAPVHQQAERSLTLLTTLRTACLRTVGSKHGVPPRVGIQPRRKRDCCAGTWAERYFLPTDTGNGKPSLIHNRLSSRRK